MKMASSADQVAYMYDDSDDKEEEKEGEGKRGI